ncbi:hypothetical protein MAPG_09511 [Magnaporthiopsis poae ATCC 64411]|uniref:Cytochrome P450 n=1 Tax=Magnaporthiopsis poae (strain ATCC 64411 / 73-15) TaxID=644358 RepID=A0A0C4EA52_MAGP6|nr:hypothetical protein MAPG_09511 [Magnaporthiopsis poae ATCC 64411]
MAYALEAIATILALYAAKMAFDFLRTLAKARAIGLPIVFVPVDMTPTLWVIIGPHLRKPLQRILPPGLWRRISLTIFGWEFQEGLRPFEHFVPGDCGRDSAGSFVLVGLTSLQVWTADPVAASEITQRVRDFEIPRSHAPALGPYGPNVLSTNGERWAMHRKIVTGVLDERISRAVFEESSHQVAGLLDEVFASSSSSSNDNALTYDTERLFDTLKRVTIHVLLNVSMGAKVPWSSRHEPATPEPGYTMSHISSLLTTVVNLVGVGLLPVGILCAWPRWLPWHDLMNLVGRARRELYRRSKSILDGEREKRRAEATAAEEAADDGGKRGANIMSKLLRASESADNGYGLTEDEMISNLFAVTAAGFETTAASLSFALVLLARYPLWQDWLLEEIDELSAITQSAAGPPQPVKDGSNGAANGSPSSSTPRADYHTIFPRAMRIQAVMFETLRLYSPVPHVHRETASAQKLNTSSGKTVVLPERVRINIDSIALHLLPCWRDVNRQSDPIFVGQQQKQQQEDLKDERVYRPSRWLNPPGSAQKLYRPPKGTWVPWSRGGRVCPGQKMAQVEFAAVLWFSDVLSSGSIRGGEGPAETQARLDRRLADSRWVTVLQMNGVFGQREGEGLAMRLRRRR